MRMNFRNCKRSFLLTCWCGLQRAVHDRDMEIIESQFDITSDLGCDHDANASDDSGDEVCASLTQNYSSIHSILWWESCVRWGLVLDTEWLIVCYLRSDYVVYDMVPFFLSSLVRATTILVEATNLTKATIPTVSLRKTATGKRNWNLEALVAWKAANTVAQEAVRLVGAATIYKSLKLYTRMKLLTGLSIRVLWKLTAGNIPVQDLHMVGEWNTFPGSWLLKIVWTDEWFSRANQQHWTENYVALCSSLHTDCHHWVPTDSNWNSMLRAFSWKQKQVPNTHNNRGFSSREPVRPNGHARQSEQGEEAEDELGLGDWDSDEEASPSRGKQR